MLSVNAGVAVWGAKPGRVKYSARAARAVPGTAGASARGVAEGGENAKRRQAGQRAFVGGRANTVIDHRHAGAVGDLHHSRGEILGAVVDGVVTAMGLGDGRLLVAADGPDDGRAKLVQPLANDQTDAAGGGMEQHGLAGFDRKRLGDQIGRGEALQHHRRRLLIGDVVGQGDQSAGRVQPRLGVGSRRPHDIGHPVAGFDVADIGADRLDHTGRLHADGTGEFHRVFAGTLINVDEVQTDHGLAHQRLPRAGRLKVDLLPLHDFGAAGFLDDDGVGHGFWSF